MKRLNLIHALRIGKSFIAPMVLMGLFLCIGTNEANAQNFKDYKDSQLILKSELSQINQIPVRLEASVEGGGKTNAQGLSSVDLEARRMFFTKVLKSINKDVDVEAVVNETMAGFNRFPESALRNALVKAKAYTVQILSN